MTPATIFFRSIRVTRSGLLPLLLVLALVLSGCAGSGRSARRHKAATQSGTLTSLYSRLPAAQTPKTPKAPKKPEIVIPETVTPQSELSQKVAQKLGPRIKGEFQRFGLRLGAPVFVRIFKESHELELWVQRGERYYLFRKYRIAYFSGGLGPKFQEGDQQAPEGFYGVTPDNMNPRSNYHLSFNIGYPNQFDVERGATGGLIMVHGKRASIGCFAMTDAIIEEIYTIADAALNGGQAAIPVHVFPFRMTPANLQRHSDSKYANFWRSILHGYTLFELTHVPPQIAVRGGRYAFSPGKAGRNALSPASTSNMVSIQRDLQVLP